jgi:hypothetical protein
MVGVYAKQPPTPKPIPWDKIRWVTLEENELIAKEKHIMTTPIVDTQRAILGTRIIKMIASGAKRYAIPCGMSHKQKEDLTKMMETHHCTSSNTSNAS